MQGINTLALHSSFWNNQLRFFKKKFIQKNLNLYFSQAVSITGTEICPKIFWEKILEKSLCAQAWWQEEQAILLLRLCTAFWDICYAECQIKSSFQTQTGNFRPVITELKKKISTSPLVCGWQHQPDVGTWDCDSALLLLLVKLPSDRCLSCKATTVPGNLAGDCLLLFIKLVLFCQLEMLLNTKGGINLSEGAKK